MPADDSLDQITIRRQGVGLRGHETGASAGGFTLYAPQTAGGLVDLVAIDGSIAHQWNLPVRPGRDAVILPNGNLGYNGSHATSLGLYPAWDIWHGGDFMEVTPAGEIVWRYEDPAHHHDGQWLDNGNILYAAAAPLPADKVARLKGGAPAKGEGVVPQSDIIREVDRAGNVVWEWRAWDHLDPEDYPLHEIFDRSHWPLVNGITVTRDGLVLLSLRTTSGIIAVDKASGAVKWRVAGNTAHQQHSPRELDDGSILIFDNGNIRSGVSATFSRAVAFEPGTGRITWSYVDNVAPNFYSPFMGSAERLWNGNTLICESAFGRIFEVTPEGRVVWEYVIPHFNEYPSPLNRFITGRQNSCFKAHRYPAEALPWL